MQISEPRRTKSKSKNKQINCDKEVKTILSSIVRHKKCTTSINNYQYATEIEGKKFNEWIIGQNSTTKFMFPFKEEKQYFICSNLRKTMKNGIKYLNPRTLSSLYCQPANELNDISTTIDINAETPSLMPLPQIDETPVLTGDEVAPMRNRIHVNDLNGIQSIRVMVGGDENNIIDLNSGIYKKRSSRVDMFHKDVTCKPNFYRVPFGNCKMRHRRIRMKDIGAKIISACINRKDFKKNPNEYLYNNEELAVDIINLLDGVKDFIQTKMKMKFNDFEDVAMVPVLGDEDGLIGVLDEKRNGYELAKILLHETSASGYHKVKVALKYSNVIPSYYMMTKDRPNVTDLILNLKDYFLYETSSEYPELTEDQELDIVQHSVAQKDSDTIRGAVLEGTYSDHIALIEDKHKKERRTISNESNVFVIDSIDGAEHLRSKSKVSSVISFSSSLTCPSWLQSGEVSAGSSKHILTWQQLMGQETLCTVVASVTKYLEDKKKFRTENESRSNYYCYELHDGKMLYTITKHSQWNRRNFPYLLCKCGRREGVINNDTHKCVILSDDEQKRLYNRSERKWNYKSDKRIKEGKTYEMKEHLDWVDINNDGCSHFGIDPDLFPRSGIRFDTFHMKCAITRKMMGFTRSFLLNQTKDIIDLFSSKILKSFYNDYHLYIWENRKGFSSFVGNELVLFVANTSSITDFFEEHTNDTQTMTDMCTALKLWVDIFKFLGISHLRDMTHENYLEHLRKFKDNVKEFYRVGANTFLSKPGTPGSEETFYSHTLRYYMPSVADTTFERHKTGVGIFTMQGFERRNKESKTTLKRFSNSTGNVLISNLRRVWDIFAYTKGESKDTTN